MTAFDEILARLDGLESLIRAQAGPGPRWLDLTAAACYSSLSRSTLRRAVRAGKLKVARQHEKTLVKISALDAFIEGPRR